MSSSQSISVIIPTNRKYIYKRGTLFDLVHGLIESSLPIYELIVIGQWDSMFLEDSSDIGIHITPINFPASTNRSLLRNEGCRKASGKYYLFLDDDTIALPSNSFCTQFSEISNDCVITFGQRLFLDIDIPYQKIHSLIKTNKFKQLSRLAGPMRGHLGPKVITQYTYITNFGIIPSQLFHEVGGFDCEYCGWGYEDIDFMNRLLIEHSIITCKNTCTCIHIDHPVSPYKYEEATNNAYRYHRKRNTDPLLPSHSPEYLSLRADKNDVIFPNSNTYTEKDIIYWFDPISWLNHHNRDKVLLATIIKEWIKNNDYIALGVYGSALYQKTPQDIDICLITASYKHNFKILKLPSGLAAEIHTISMWSIKEQITNIHKYGDVAYMLYSKWKKLKILHDTDNIVSEHISNWFKSAPAALPYMISLYVGLIKIYLEKTESAESLCLGRYVTCLAMLANTTIPAIVTITDRNKCKVWFDNICRSLVPIYRHYLLNTHKNNILRSPPNFVGDDVLAS